MGRGLIRSYDQYYCQILSYGQTHSYIQVCKLVPPTIDSGTRDPHAYSSFSYSCVVKKKRYYYQHSKLKWRGGESIGPCAKYFGHPILIVNTGPFTKEIATVDEEENNFHIWTTLICYHGIKWKEITLFISWNLVKGGSISPCAQY